MHDHHEKHQILEVDLAGIPEPLKQLPQWVCWRLEDRGDGKMAKPPIDPKTGSKASIANPRTWGTFEEALEYYEQFKNHGCCGLGFVFTREDPYVGIDLDKYRDATTGEIEPWALEVVQSLSSYTELSPSGTGLHVIVRGVLPPGPRRSGRIELYDCARYFTMTGHILPGSPSAIKNRQEVLDVIFDELLDGRKGDTPRGHKAQAPLLAPCAVSERADCQASQQQLEEVELTPADEKILRRVESGQEGKIYQLLIQGKWEEAGIYRKNGPYTSPSEADQALMNKLARLTRDAGRTKALFLETELARRDKVNDREDYVDITVRKAMGGLEWQPTQKKQHVQEVNLNG